MSIWKTRTMSIWKELPGKVLPWCQTEEKGCLHDDPVSNNFPAFG